MDSFLVLLDLVSLALDDNLLNRKLKKFDFYNKRNTAGKTIINLMIIIITVLVIIGVGFLITKL